MQGVIVELTKNMDPVKKAVFCLYWARINDHNELCHCNICEYAAKVRRRWPLTFIWEEQHGEFPTGSN